MVDTAPFVIGVAGGSCSGKTTFVQKILKLIGEESLTYLKHDSYYKSLSHLTYEEREKVNFDHPDALDTELFIQQVEGLLQGKVQQVPQYDFTQHNRKSIYTEVFPQPVIVLEGILLFVSPRLRELMDLRIFLDASSDIRLIRRMERDLQRRGRSQSSILRQHFDTVQPMYEEFVAPSKKYAHLILPSSENMTPTIDLLLTKIQTVLTSPTKSEL